MKRETREVNGTASPSADVSFLYAQDRATLGSSGNDALGGGDNVTLGSKIRAFYERRVRLLTIFALACILSVSGVLIAKISTDYNSHAVNTAQYQQGIYFADKGLEYDLIDKLSVILTKYDVQTSRTLIANDIFLDDNNINVFDSQDIALMIDVLRESFDIYDDLLQPELSYRLFGLGIPTAIVSVPINLLVSVIPGLNAVNAAMSNLDKARAAIIGALSVVSYALNYIGQGNMANAIMGAANWIRTNWFPLTVGGAIAYVLDAIDKNGVNGWIKF